MRSYSDSNIDSVISGDPKNSYSLDRHALKEMKDNLLCPIKLLLVNANRHGNVHGTSVEDVLARASANATHGIEWIDADLPILCNVTPTNVWRDSPMRVKSMRQVFDLIQSLVKSDRRLRCHDIRYGAAQDLLHVQRPSNLTLTEIAGELNHSVESVAKGVTRRYTKKASTMDTWQARVELPDKPMPFSSIIFKAALDTSTGSKRQQRLSDGQELTNCNDPTAFINILSGLRRVRPVAVIWRPRDFPNDTHTQAVPLVSQSSIMFAKRIHLIPRTDTIAHDGRFICGLPGCLIEPGKGFKKEKHLNLHQLKSHDKFLPTACPVPQCPSDDLIQTFDNLVSHMDEQHLIPGGVKARAACRISCRFEECGQFFPRNTPSIYAIHLRSQHKLQDSTLTDEERGDGTAREKYEAMAQQR